MVSQLRERLRKMPKVDLHRHLEGSIRPRTLLEIALDANIEATSDITVIMVFRLGPGRVLHVRLIKDS